MAADDAIHQTEIPFSISKGQIKAIGPEDIVQQVSDCAAGIKAVDHFVTVMAGQIAAAGQHKHDVVINDLMLEYAPNHRIIKGFGQFKLGMIVE